MLRYDFLPYSPASRRLVDFQERGAEGELLAAVELARAEHLKAAPGRIASGRMTQDQADRIADTYAAIGADLRTEAEFLTAVGKHIAAGGDVAGAPRIPLPRAGDVFTWEDKLHVLRREIHFRRTYDPDRVAKGRLDPEAARRQLERLEALQDKYWRQMFAWNPPAGADAPHWGDPSHPDFHTPGAELHRQAVREHAARLDLAEQARASGDVAAEAGAQPDHEQQEALPV